MFLKFFIFNRDSSENSNRSLSHKLLITLYYIIIVFLSHLIMFILMTYSFGIIMSVLFGNAVGFFIFGLSKNSEIESSPLLH